MEHDGVESRDILWIALLAGMWLLISPMVLGFTGLVPAVWNSVVVGAVIILIAAYFFFVRGRLDWSGWALVALGAWLIVSPYVLGYPSTMPAVWNHIILGAVTGLVGLYVALTARRGIHIFR